jgi:hypothetical protein
MSVFAFVASVSDLSASCQPFRFPAASVILRGSPVATALLYSPVP